MLTLEWQECLKGFDCRLGVGSMGQEVDVVQGRAGEEHRGCCPSALL